MNIQVIYEDETSGTIEPSLLDELLSPVKIKKFRRSDGWVAPGVDPVRNHGNGYHGRDRRRSTHSDYLLYLEPDGHHLAKGVCVTDMKKRLVSACAFQELFESMPGMFLVLDREYRVAAASDAFLQSSGLSREGILGRSLFDIYASGDAGHGALRRSMDRAILTGEPDAMAVGKFDITSPEGGAVIRGDRYFGMVNYPVFISERGAAFVIHRVEDLTDFIRLREWCSREKDGMSPSNGEMCAMAAAAYGLSRELAEDNNRLLERNAKLKRELDNLKTKDESRTGRAGKRILVVEDDELVSKFLVSLFKTHGSVDLAYNGADALDRTRERRYDLVISDVRMPLMDGISFFREAAKSDSGLCERIIFYSGALTDIDEKFIRENKLRVLIKPALVPDLMNAAREILTKGEPEPSSPPIE